MNRVIQVPSLLTGIVAKIFWFNGIVCYYNVAYNNIYINIYGNAYATEKRIHNNLYKNKISFTIIINLIFSDEAV
jgi:hypothetical protein